METWRSENFPMEDEHCEGSHHWRNPTFGLTEVQWEFWISLDYVAVTLTFAPGIVGTLVPSDINEIP